MMAAIAATLVGACALGESAEVAEATLDAVRAATGKYADVTAALADGYARDPLDICETPYHLGRTNEAGVMGIHYLRRDLLGIGEDGTRLDVSRTHTDFHQPAVLVYEPQEDGSLKLVALENLVSAAAWKAEGNTEPPAFGGVAFTYAPDDPGMSIAAYYDLHVWLYRENPLGMLAPYNPNASCQHHVFHMPMMHPMP
jgi:hypothetical protein